MLIGFLEVQESGLYVESCHLDIIIMLQFEFKQLQSMQELFWLYSDRRLLQTKVFCASVSDINNQPYVANSAQYYNNIAQMRPIKKQIVTHQHPKNAQFTPNILVRKGVSLRKKIVGQSAQQTSRDNKPEFKVQYEKGYAKEQQICNSAIYRLLQQQIRMMTRRHQTQLCSLKEIKSQRQGQLSQLKKDEFNTKLQIWQLKNEVMELKEAISDENQETERLTSELALADPQHIYPIQQSP